MPANGFFEQSSASPTGLGTVLLLHAAAVAGVLFIKGPDWSRPEPTITNTYNVRPEPIPPIDPPEQPRTELPLPQTPRSQLDVPPRVVPTALPNTTAETTTTVPTPFTEPAGTSETGSLGNVIEPRPLPPQPQPEVRPRTAPVRVDAAFDPRFAGALQPPYPVAEQREGNEGSVRIRVTIGATGRVLAASRLSATSEAFWRATQRQALSRWRFRPASVDGRPVEGSKDLTVHFRLDGQ